VQIGPAGMNINADLAFNGYNATTFRSVRFTAQGSPLGLSTDKGCIYESGVDLYYNDGSGNQIRLTQSGGVAGSSGSIGSLASPASATYSAGSKTFIWQSGSTKAAAMDNGAITIRETDVASAKGITLSSPTSLAADYSLVLPTALPASNSYLGISTSGNLSTATANQIVAATTRSTGTTVGAGGVAISNSSGSYSTSSSSFTAVTNLSVTITTSGRPVYVGLIPDGTSNTTNSCYIYAINSGSNSLQAFLEILRGASVVSQHEIGLVVGAGDIPQIFYPPGNIWAIDVIGAGTYTYSVSVSCQSSASNMRCYNSKLIAYEL
jgi:hypothetical protein